jgi:hypothetical protein
MDDFSAADPRGDLVHQLRKQLGRYETVLSTAGAAAFSSGTFSSDESSSGTFSSGTAAIDRLLPGGGLRHGMLVEWLAKQTASGAATLSLLSAREASRLGGLVVVIDRRQTFYPPAAAAWGLDLDRLIVVHPQTARDELWAAVQSLRSPVVAAVWATLQRIDDRAFRRLQLAAETGHTLGLLVRPANARGQPSWADVRLWTASMEQGTRSRELLHARSMLHAFYRCAYVRILHCRGGRSDGSVCLEIDDTVHAVREVKTNHDAHSLPVVAELADPTARPFSAGA